MAYFADGLKRRIVLALGLAPVMLASQGGCAGRSLDDPDDGGDGSAESGEDDDGATESATTGTSTNSGTGDGSSSDSGPPPPLQTCWPSETNNYLEWEVWLPLGPEGECVCDETCQSTALAEWNDANCCDSCWYVFGETLCSEPLGEQCHYIVTMLEDGCGKGRPLFVDDEARTATACSRDDWADAPREPRVESLSEEHRRALAEYWTDAALAEHASVASFARFALDLTALGAPPELLGDATVAMQDEIRHAQIAFGLAGAYADAPVGPGPIAMEGLAVGGQIEAIVRAAVREGCIEETLAAAEAELAAHRATDPAVRAALASIAEDEARHAVLAWRFVDWAVARDRSLARVVREELARAEATMDSEPVAVEVGLPDDVASAHGVLPSETRHRLRRRCLEGTVRPCAAAMLYGRDHTAAPQA